MFKSIIPHLPYRFIDNDGNVVDAESSTRVEFGVRLWRYFVPLKRYDRVIPRSWGAPPARNLSERKAQWATFLEKIQGGD